MTQNISGHRVLSLLLPVVFTRVLCCLFSEVFTTTSISCSWMRHWPVIPLVNTHCYSLFGDEEIWGRKWSVAFSVWCRKVKQTVSVSSSLTGPLNLAATWTCPAPPRTSASAPAAEHGLAAPPALGCLGFCLLLPPLSPLLFALELFIFRNQMAFPNPEIEKPWFRTHRSNKNAF